MNANDMTSEREDPAHRFETHERRLRLTSGGVPTHLEDRVDQQREARRRDVQLAITNLEAEETPPWPDVDAIIEHAGFPLSKNRIYAEKDLMYEAQSRWNDREEAAGRRRRKLRGGNLDERKDWVAATDFEELKKKLEYALEKITELKERNKRLTAANVSLREDAAKLELGVYDEIWPPTN